jgi:ATP-binding cassette, subfamily B, bacterial
VVRLNKNTFKILGLELRKVKSIRAISFIQGTFVNLLRQAIMFLLLWLVFRGRLTPGEVTTMLFYSFFIFGPLQELGNIIQTYREAEASMVNFDNLMRKQPEMPPMHPKPLGSIRELIFREVVFQHKTAQYRAVDRISFEVRKGETIAFAGPSGSGKTTLMKLIVGLYRTQQGHILYNGLDESTIDFDDLRRQIGFVTQDTQLFAGTIRENLMFVHPQASEADLTEALRKASCTDSLTEEDITRTIRDVSSQGDQITILIAHRLSTIMHADRIYVLEKGEVEEVGTHMDLLASKGLYYAMWRQQIGERKYAANVAANN